MANSSREIESARKIEDLIQDFLQRNPEARYVDRNIFMACYATIKPWLDLSILVSFLMKYELARTSSDMEQLTSPFHLSEMRHQHLWRLAESGGEHGFMLLYMCIWDSIDQCPLGHGDAIIELDRCARERNVVPPWSRPRADYRPPLGLSNSSRPELSSPLQPSQVEDGLATSLLSPSTSSSTTLSSLREGSGSHHQLTPQEQLGGACCTPTMERVECRTTSSRREEIERNLGTREASKHYSKSSTTTTYTKIKRGEGNAVNPNPISATPQEESDPLVPHSDVSLNSYPSRPVYLNPNSRAGRGSPDDERDAGKRRPKNGDDTESLTEEDFVKKHSDETQRLHDQNIASLKKDMNISANFSNNTCIFETSSLQECPDLNALKCLISKFAVAVLNARDTKKPGVLIVGVDTSESEKQDYHVTGLPYLEESTLMGIRDSIHQDIRYCEDNGNERRNLQTNFTKAMIKADIISLIPVKEAAALPTPVLLLTVLPNNLLCHDSVFQQTLTDMCGQIMSSRVFRMICDDVTGHTDISELSDENKVKKLRARFKNFSC